MLDMVGTIGGTASYALIVGALIGFSPLRTSVKLVLLAVAATWGVVIVGSAAVGGFAPGAAGPLPTPVLAFLGLFLLLFGGWWRFSRFRQALLSVPMAVLVGLNSLRIGGVFFLILAADGRLSAPFAPTAGWGDIVTALLAVPLAIALARRSGLLRMPLALWNAFGTLDLIVAISLGLFSAPNTPWRVFFEAPGTAAMAALPWVMVPAMLVPFYLLIHLTIAAQLRSSRQIALAPAMVA